MNTSHFHPLTVHFPIALTVLGFALLTLFMIKQNQKNLFSFAFFTLLLALAGMGAAWISGEYFTPEFTGELEETKELHEFYCKVCFYVLLGGIVVWSLLRKKQEKLSRWILYIASAVSLGVILYTAWLGGSMVYDQMIPQELLKM